MSEIVNVPPEASGVGDAVEMEVNCVHTKFYEKEMGQTVIPCSVKASWENGVVSIGFTVDDQHQSVAVRLDELLMLLQAANEARNKVRGAHVEP